METCGKINYEPTPTLHMHRHSIELFPDWNLLPTGSLQEIFFNSPAFAGIWIPALSLSGLNHFTNFASNNEGC